MLRDKLKILYPIGSFYPSQSGGPNNTIYWIAKALAEKSVHVSVVTTDSGINKSHDVELNKTLNTKIGTVVYVSTLFIYLPIFAFLHTLSKIRKNDVVHLNSIFYPLSWLSVIANELFYKKPIVWSPRGELDPEALVYSSWKKKPIIRLINKGLLSKIYFHSTCSAETKYIKENFGGNNKIVELPNYLALPDYIDCDKKNYFLYIGRIHPKKAIENLIKGLSISSCFLKSNFVLKIAGDINSKYGKKLVSLAYSLGLKDRVEFLGLIESIEKQRIIAEAYFSFMPSHTENFGNVVVEALAQATPVVASKGTPWEILTLNNAGFWIDNSPDEIAHTVDNILNLDVVNYKKMSINALFLAKQEFDISKNIDKWISFYDSVING